ncbi:MAG: hypothetical protein WBL81_13995 [Pseudolabrys sp.]
MRALHIQLISELKEMVEKGEVQLQAALRAQKIATHNGTVENMTAVAQLDGAVFPTDGGLFGEG